MLAPWIGQFLMRFLIARCSGHGCRSLPLTCAAKACRLHSSDRLNAWDISVASIIWYFVTLSLRSLKLVALNARLTLGIGECFALHPPCMQRINVTDMTRLWRWAWNLSSLVSRSLNDLYMYRILCWRGTKERVLQCPPRYLRFSGRAILCPIELHSLY